MTVHNSLMDCHDDTSELEHYKDLALKLETVIEFSTDGIYVVDSNGVTVLVNRAYEEMTGYKKSDLVGKNVFDLTEKGYFDRSISKLVFKEKKQLSIVQKIGNEEKLGEKKEVVVTGSPVFDEHGDLSLIVISVSDITEISKMKRELTKAMETAELNSHRFAVHTEFEKNQTIVFRSPQMKQVYEKIQQVAPFPTSILLSGPSGVGKEMLTNLIHHFSDRKEKPLIKINCGAIPENLLESELFGYEKGSFTGARLEGKAGLLELADEGTIMLDEIGEMPLALQVKLLRVIQEKQVRRIGGNKTKDLDIRIISVTNKNLEELVKQGQFREDLYYRLNVVSIDVPPLAERPEDVRELLQYFFSYFSKKYHIQKEAAEETVRYLMSYHWPGNVRELRNMVENLIVSVSEKILEPYHLPFRITQVEQGTNEVTLKSMVQNYEKKIIMEALQKNNSLRQAAKELGIHHTTLVKKLQAWKM
ncbi:sigma-54 interaction domain-containing protein [Siminovitchia acidinfaciens]|nr:sigma 54-interacting transcriptional regulator [Siminovitchia acidinfaciens]